MKDVRRDYDRFVEKTKEHTKVSDDCLIYLFDYSLTFINSKGYDRSISPSSMLPPPHPSSEFTHRPVLTGSNHDMDKPSRSRSFYDHQVHEYESHRSHRNQNSSPAYSTLPAGGKHSDRYRSPSPSASWNPSAQQYSHYPSDRRPSFTRSSSRSEFPDFAPLSSPLEIKSLTENTIKSSNRHVSTYH